MFPVKRAALVYFRDILNGFSEPVSFIPWRFNFYIVKVCLLWQYHGLAAGSCPYFLKPVLDFSVLYQANSGAGERGGRWSGEMNLP